MNRHFNPTTGPTARDLTQLLGGRWHGSYGTAACLICQPERRRDQAALSIGAGRDGRLLLRCHKLGCDFADILAAAGLRAGTGRAFRPDPAATARRDAERRADSAKRAAQAERLWREAQPVTGTPAEIYLRGRGISCALPPTLRFHRECWHGPTAKRHPALIALVEGGDGFAVHRTYLRADGSGKAGLDGGDKLMLGGIAGGAVRLSDGPGPLLVAEGIETALSLRDGLAHLSPRTWAGLSAAGVAALRLPKPAREIVIGPDNDPAGRRAAETLARRAWAAGWRVKVLEPPAAGDWNDAALAGFATLAGPDARISEGAR